MSHKAGIKFCVFGACSLELVFNGTFERNSEMMLLTGTALLVRSGSLRKLGASVYKENFVRYTYPIGRFGENFN